MACTRKAISAMRKLLENVNSASLFILCSMLFNLCCCCCRFCFSLIIKTKNIQFLCYYLSYFIKWNYHKEETQLAVDFCTTHYSWWKECKDGGETRGLKRRMNWSFHNGRIKMTYYYIYIQAKRLFISRLEMLISVTLLARFACEYVCKAIAFIYR